MQRSQNLKTKHSSRLYLQAPDLGRCDAWHAPCREGKGSNERSKWVIHRYTIILEVTSIVEPDYILSRTTRAIASTQTSQLGMLRVGRKWMPMSLWCEGAVWHLEAENVGAAWHIRGCMAHTQLWQCHTQLWQCQASHLWKQEGTRITTSCTHRAYARWAWTDGDVSSGHDSPSLCISGLRKSPWSCFMKHQRLYLTCTTPGK